MAGRRIGLFLRAVGNDYQDLLREDCQLAADRRGLSLEVFSADGDGDKQIRQIRNCLDSPEILRPIAMLVSPVRESVLLTAAREAARMDIGWIILNRWNDNLLDLRGEFPRLPIFAVNPDQKEVGRIQARQFKILLPQGGELLYIQDPMGTSSALRRFTGMREELEAAPINVVTFNSDWSSEGGERATREWLRIFGSRPLAPHVVGAQNDNMAMGARKALMDRAGVQQRAAGSQSPVTGCDGSPAYGQRLVKIGRLTATVVIPPVAGRAVDELASMLETGRSPPAEIVVSVSSYPDLARLARLSAR